MEFSGERSELFDSWRFRVAWRTSVLGRQQRWNDERWFATPREFATK
jgi:hypothetical protein